MASSGHHLEPWTDDRHTDWDKFMHPIEMRKGPRGGRRSPKASCRQDKLRKITSVPLATPVSETGTDQAEAQERQSRGFGNGYGLGGDVHVEEVRAIVAVDIAERPTGASEEEGGEIVRCTIEIEPEADIVTDAADEEIVKLRDNDGIGSCRKSFLQERVEGIAAYEIDRRGAVRPRNGSARSANRDE